MPLAVVRAEGEEDTAGAKAQSLSDCFNAGLEGLLHPQFFFSKASITASWNLGRICLIAWLEQSGQVRLVSRVIESWRVGSIQREVPV